MRQQYRANKMFGLVLGSGVSKPFGLPNWDELIKRVANNSDVRGKEILDYKKDRSPQASVTQMLYEHFKNQEIEKRGLEGSPLNKEVDNEIFKKWRNIIHTELWRDFKEESLERNKHPYIDTYIEIIKNSNLTINYNFDNTIQTIINKRKTEQEKRKGLKLFETVWDARLQFQKSKGILYHPNGFLPKNLIDGSSDNLVFSEDSFADQLIASMSGHYSTLLHHLSKNTCLFIGLSLEDNTLKHLLRQSALINPGHFHYYIAYTPDKSSLSQKNKNAIKESNFELYNLITLFLDEKEIKELGKLIQMDDDEFKTAATITSVSKKFVFYLTGSVGCGKTTTLQYFRNLATYSEWPEQKHPLLVKSFDSLTPSETKEVDEWISKMFFIKNVNLHNLSEGITVIDRTPLDPFVFTDKDNDGWQKKAEILNESIGKSKNAFRIVKGQVIILKGNPETISRRIKARHKTSSIEYESSDIEEMYEKFDEIFDDFDIKIIETDDLSIHEVVKKVARAIHLDRYEDNDLHTFIDKNLNS